VKGIATTLRPASDWTHTLCVLNAAIREWTSCRAAIGETGSLSAVTWRFGRRSISKFQTQPLVPQMCHEQLILLRLSRDDALITSGERNPSTALIDASVFLGRVVIVLSPRRIPLPLVHLTIRHAGRRRGDYLLNSNVSGPSRARQRTHLYTVSGGPRFVQSRRLHYSVRMQDDDSDMDRSVFLVVMIRICGPTLPAGGQISGRQTARSPGALDCRGLGVQPRPTVSHMTFEAPPDLPSEPPF